MYTCAAARRGSYCSTPMLVNHQHFEAFVYKSASPPAPFDPHKALSTFDVPGSRESEYPTTPGAKVTYTAQRLSTPCETATQKTKTMNVPEHIIRRSCIYIHMYMVKTRDAQKVQTFKGLPLVGVRETRYTRQKAKNVVAARMNGQNTSLKL